MAPVVQGGTGRVRVVGSRTIPADFPNDIDLMTDEDIDVLRDEVRARREGCADDGAIDEALAKAALARVDDLKPSIRAFAHFLFSAIRPTLRQRMVEGHRVCLLVHLPDARWERVARRSMTGAVDLVEADRRYRLGSSGRAVGARSPRFGRKAEYVALDDVIASIGAGHTIVTVKPGEVVSAAVRAMADVEITWDAKEWLDEIVAAIRLRFPAFVWPRHVDVREIHSRYIDVAVSRSQVAAVVPEYLARFVNVLTDEEEADAAQAKADAEGKADAAASRKKVGSIEILRPTSPRLEDLYVSASFRTWADDLVRDVADHRAGRLPWSETDGGCLLHGPTGTGKTMIVSALAASLGVSFIASSFAHWQGSRGGHLGDVVSEMRKTFAAAAENAPCLLFIDEIDSIPARNASKEYDDYWRAVVNGLLECLDGTARREGVIVIGATNEPSRLDPALVRSGRLDRRFEIGLPGEDGLLAVMRHHLPDADGEALRPAAATLAGSASPADVARIAREARRVARREDRTVTAEDLLAIALPEDTRPAELRRLAAVHEAGHAVVSMLRGRIPSSMSVVESPGQHGGVAFDVVSDCGRLKDLEATVVTLLAGRAAEEVLLDVVSGGSGGAEGSDLAVATNLVSAILGNLGLGGRLSVGRVSPAAVEDHLQVLYRRAVETVTSHRDDVEALAALVGERRVLSRAALQTFAAERGIGR